MVSPIGFDFESYFRDTNHNIQQACKVLEPYIEHFQVIDSAYSALLRGINVHDIANEHSKLARVQYLSSMSVNLVKALANVFAGHFSDANIFNRKSIESVRYSIFLREAPEVAEIWLKTDEAEYRKTFNQRFNRWLERDGGRSLVEKETDISRDYWERLSNVGPHSNVSLLSFQSEFRLDDGIHKIRTKFHEIESGPSGTAMLFQYFFLALSVHYKLRDWWLRSSGLQFDISKDLKKYWAADFNKFIDAVESHRPLLEKYLRTDDPFTKP